MNRLGRTIMEIVKAWKVWSARMVCRELDDADGPDHEHGITAKLDEMADDGALLRREQEEGPTIYYHKGHRHED